MGRLEEEGKKEEKRVRSENSENRQKREEKRRRRLGFDEWQLGLSMSGEREENRRR